jgi:outer membrane protein
MRDINIMKFIQNILITAIFLIAGSAFADNHNDYDANYYEDEGALLFKIRGFYVNAPTKIKTAPINGTEKPGDLVQNGYGFDTATTYFFTDNIATELSLGLGLLKTKSSALNKAAAAYGNGTGSPGKKNDIFFVPLAATLQYHIAPFGAIRPYIGAGYHGSYLYTRSKAIKVQPGHGAVLQAGIDFMAKDDTFITFDIRQYILKSKVTFKKGFLFPNNAAAKDVSSKVDYNPLVISFGVGFKF